MQVSVCGGQGTSVKVLRGTTGVYGSWVHIYLDDVMLTVDRSIAVAIVAALQEAMSEVAAEAEIK